MGIEDFNGTSNSAAHIGDKAAKNLAAALFPTTEPLKVVITAGAEAADIIRITLQVQDRDGRNLAESAKLHVRLYDAAMVESLVAAFTLTEVASEGSFVTTDVRPACIIDTESDGTASIDVEDEATGSGLTIHALVEFLDREGATFLQTLTFD